MSIFKKTVKKTVTLPVKLVVNNSVKQDTSMYKSTLATIKQKVTTGSGDDIICPVCLQGVFTLIRKVENNEEGQILAPALWCCNNCSATVESQDDNPITFKSIVENNALNWYHRTRSYTQEEQTLIDKATTRLVRQSQLALLGFLSFLVYCIYAILFVTGSTSVFLIINMTLMLTLLLLVALRASFFAWINHNNYLYIERRALLKYWIKNGSMIIITQPVDDQGKFLTEYVATEDPQ